MLLCARADKGRGVLTLTGMTPTRTYIYIEGYPELLLECRKILLLSMAFRCGPFHSSAVDLCVSCCPPCISFYALLQLLG